MKNKIKKPNKTDLRLGFWIWVVVVLTVILVIIYNTPEISSDNQNNDLLGGSSPSGYKNVFVRLRFYNDDGIGAPGFEKKISTHFTYTNSEGQLIVSHDNQISNDVEWLTIMLKETAVESGVQCDIIGLNLQDGIGDKNNLTPIKYSPNFKSTFYMPTQCTNTELNYPYEIPSEQVYRQLELSWGSSNPLLNFWDVTPKQNRHTLIFETPLLQEKLCVENGVDVFDPK